MSRRTISTTIVAPFVLTTSVSTQGAAGAATTTPAQDRIGANLHVLTWGVPLADPSTHRGKAIVVTNRAILAKVRTLIASLLVTVPDPHQMCPMGLVCSPALAFSVSRRSPMVTSVVVQLGGCAYAQVYPLGRPITPTLGGTRLDQVFHQIEQLVKPRAAPSSNVTPRVFLSRRPWRQ